MYQHVIGGVKQHNRYSPRPILPALVSLAALLLVASPSVRLAAGQAQTGPPPFSASDRGCPPLRSAGSARFSCEYDALLTRQFTPPHMPAGTYRAYRTTAAIDTIVRAFRTVWGAGAPAASWTIGEADPRGTFGRLAPYDQGKLARLYGGIPARVARGPIVEGGRTVASITLVSPYPSPLLVHLEPGTLIIDFSIPSWRPSADSQAGSK
jgi:hypothetical protein